jgi:hypothetical protein
MMTMSNSSLLQGDEFGIIANAGANAGKARCMAAKRSFENCCFLRMRIASSPIVPLLSPTTDAISDKAVEEGRSSPAFFHFHAADRPFSLMVQDAVSAGASGEVR